MDERCPIAVGRSPLLHDKAGVRQRELDAPPRVANQR